MEYEFSVNGLSQSSSDMLILLFKKRKAIVGLMGGATSEKGKKLSNVTPRSCVNLNFISKLFFMVFLKNVPKEEIDAPTRALRSDIDLVQFLVVGTCDSLRSAINDEYSHHDDKLFDISVEICQTYIHILSTEDSDSTYANIQTSTKKTPSVLVSIASSLRSILEIVNNVWPEKLIELLKHILDPTGEDARANTGKSKNRIMIETILKLRDIVLRYLSGRNPIYKEVSAVMNVVNFLCARLERKDQDYSMRALHVVKWLDEVAKERPLEEAPLAKDFTSMLIKMCSSIEEYDHIQNMCEDIRLFTGDLDAGDHTGEVEADLKYQIINIKTYVTITTQIFEFLDSSFDDLTWCTGRLKICAAESDEDITRKFEKEYCSKLVSLMIILSELVRAMLTDVHAESLFKTLVKAYKTLHTFVKYVSYQCLYDMK